MRTLITGAEQGLGQVIAAILADERQHSILNMPGEILRGGPAFIEAFLRDDKSRLGEPFTHVVNNFGINHLSWIGTTAPADEEILKVNVMGPYWVINTLVALDHPAARVLNIGSQTGRIPQRTTALYCASKAALVQMSKVMARELGPRGWIVNVLAPGKIADTKMSEMTDAQVCALRGWEPEEAESYALGLIPLRRFTTREEVALAAVALLCDMPDYVTGAVLDMAGGV